MLEKLNLYDLLGYLIPGGVLLLTGYGLGGLLVPGSLPTYKDVAGFSESLGGIVVLFGLSYPLGHLVQSFGEWWEDSGNRRANGLRPSEHVLFTHWEHGYSEKTVHLIKQRGFSTFGLDTFQEPDPQYKRLKELFSLAWCFVIQKGLGVKADVYLAISALSRGLMVATFIGVLMAGTLVIKETAESVLPHGIGPIHLATYDPNQLAIGLAALVLFAVFAFAFQFHWFRFRLYFARTIWDSFLVTSPMPEKKVHWWNVIMGSWSAHSVVPGEREKEAARTATPVSKGGS